MDKINYNHGAKSTADVKLQTSDRHKTVHLNNKKTFICGCEPSSGYITLNAQLRLKQHHRFQMKSS